MLKKKYKKVLSILLVISITLIGLWGYKQYRDIINVNTLLEENKKEINEQKSKFKENLNLQYDQDRLNILFLGFDKNESRQNEYRLFRPDGILLLSINLQTDNIDIISFPRDSRVWISHRPGKDKINASFYYGYDLGGGKTHKEKERLGYQYCVDTASEFLGNIYINNYVAVDMDGIIKTIDLIGGVTINIEEDMYNEYNGSLIVGKGLQTLSGKQFLAYIRDRDKINEHDKLRVTRTQKAFVEVYEQMKSQNIIKIIPDLFTSYKNNISTDLTIKEISALAVYGQKMKFDNISFHVIDGKYQYIGDYIYYIPDENSRINLVKKVFDFEFIPTR